MKRLLFIISIFIVGNITGSTMTSVLVGKQVDSLYIENRTLKDKLASSGEELRELKDNKESQYKRVITKVSSQVTFSGECDFSDYEKSTIELIVEKNVREWLKVIAGQEVDSINYLLVPKIIDNRELEIEGNNVRLNVELVVIAENVIVYVEVIPVKKTT